MSKEALKLALECIERGGGIREGNTVYLHDHDLMRIARDALREALAEHPAQQQEPIGWLYPEGLAALKTGKCWTAYGTKQDAECSIPIYDAVAPRVEPRASESGGGFESLPASLTTQEPAQEPVKFKCTVVDDAQPDGVPLSQWGRQPEQRPFCYHDGYNIVGKEYADHSDVFPLYTTPPQRKPLTREQVREICDGSGYDKATMQERADFINGIRHAEAAHGIKE